MRAIIALLLLLLASTPVQAEVSFVDYFNRADGDLAGNWVEADGDYQISLNSVICNTNCAAAGAQTRNTTVSRADVFVGFLVLSNTASATPVVGCRKTNDSVRTFYYFHHDGAGNYRTRELNGGTDTAVASAVITRAGNPRIVLRCEGNQIQGFENGVSVVPATTDTDITAAGLGVVYDPTHGAGTYVFDNFVMTTTSAAEADDCILNAACVAGASGGAAGRFGTMVGVGP